MALRNAIRIPDLQNKFLKKENREPLGHLHFFIFGHATKATRKASPQHPYKRRKVKCNL